MIENSLKKNLELIEIPLNITRNRAKNEEIHNLFSEVAIYYQQKWQTPNEALEYLKPARNMYRQLKIDPTRYRPSSEALLRRAIKGLNMPQINAAVDVANYICLKFLIPLGLYDTDKIQNTISLREGLPGEIYEGLGKPEVRVEGKYVLVDEKGPFGNPSSDSRRTSVDLNSKNLLMVVYTPVNYREKEEIIERTREVFAILRH